VKSTLTFLSQLDKNNNRPWFQENKLQYEQSYKEMIGFAENVYNEMSTHDTLVMVTAKKSLFRIYRDVRFGKDKTPYKTHWGGFLGRAGLENRGGYYYQIGPKASFIMGGFFAPNKEDLLHIRKQISQDSTGLRKIIKSGPFKVFFTSLAGSQLKTAPRGFDKEHTDIDLLRYKQFLLRHDFTQKQVLSKNFPLTMSNAFQEMRPFFNCMSEMLTNDLNGRSLLS